MTWRQKAFAFAQGMVIGAIVAIPFWCTVAVVGAVLVWCTTLHREIGQARIKTEQISNNASMLRDEMKQWSDEMKR